jgi:hypothetical protein
MQKFLGIAVIGFGLYLGYGVYFEYNRFNATNAVITHHEEYAVEIGNYPAANYHRNSHESPYWGKMILFGLGSVACLAIGGGLIAANKAAQAT